MKSCKLLLAAATCLLAFSCTSKVHIKGTIADTPDAKMVVKVLDGSVITTLDTVKTDGSGNFSYAMKVEEGNPQFVYLYKGDTKLASLLLSKGESVNVTADTLGRYSVEGSEESAKLRVTEEDYTSFMQKLGSIVLTGNQSAVSEAYVSYYRSCVRYVMENNKSLTSIPVLYQRINDNFPVFSQSTDAILFRNVHDSLMTVYPKSKYVEALGKEVDRRTQELELGLRVKNATEAPFPDMEMPSYDGKMVTLSSVESKVVMVYFWTAADATQKLFNNDVLIPVYKEYHDKGFEIYSVSLDTDKGIWAAAVKDQKLPWINVCDGFGANSRAVSLYNIASLPTAFFIVNGELKAPKVRGDKELRQFLSANL